MNGYCRLGVARQHYPQVHWVISFLFSFLFFTFSLQLFNFRFYLQCLEHQWILTGSLAAHQFTPIFDTTVNCQWPISLSLLRVRVIPTEHKALKS